ncbi:hypothetical protein [Mycolicibacterium sp. CBMA 234]|uniref:hypothetical protein n=1 Tax=Mycolicibacterium sp. CBMA 234 TaxID=1918495 RepID=UPI0012DE4607|nr:hypothetical protein [Mycolicibacterium sp. CBMA 234]
MRSVIDSHDVAQAALLRAELWRHVEELSQRLEKAERREQRLSDWRRRESNQLRAELYETHHLIDALNRRFRLADPVDDGDSDQFLLSG